MCVFIKHKSIFSFEISYSGSRVKQAMAFNSTKQQQQIGAWIYTKRCYLSLFNRMLGQLK